MFYLPEAGLYLTHYRVYDPTLGRWLSRDPIGEIGGVNLYAYVGNDPVNWSDPIGLQANTLPSVGPLPLIVPPVAVPGSPENKEFVENISNILPNEVTVECHGFKCFPMFNKKPRVQSEPDNCPTGTLPLDKAKKKFGLKGEDHNRIKGPRGTNSGPKDWVGIAPNGDVLTTNPDGSIENWGPVGDFLN